jgi:hypothetical protein
MKKEAANGKDQELWRELLAKDPLPPPKTDRERSSAAFEDTPSDQTCDAADYASPETITESAHHAEPAVGQLWAERFRLMERVGDSAGQTLFRGRQTDHPGFRNVAVEFLDPAFAADPEDLNLVAEQFEKLRHFDKLESFPRKQLIAYYHFERAFLVGEWLHGFSLDSLLKWKGALTPLEIVTLLDSLPALLDQLARQLFQLVEVSVTEIFLVVPDNISPRDFPSLAKQSITNFEPTHLKLNPLSLSGFGATRNETTGRGVLRLDRRLVVDETEQQSRRTIRLFGELVYELLGGQSLAGHRTAAEYRPLPNLADAANHMLRTACIGSRDAHTWPDCKEFWDAFRFQIALSSQDPVPSAESFEYDSDNEEERTGDFARYKLLTKIRVAALTASAVAAVAAGVYLVPPLHQSTINTGLAEGVSKQPIATVPSATANQDSLILAQPDDSPSSTQADGTGIALEIAAAFWAGENTDGLTFAQYNGGVQNQSVADTEPVQQPADSGEPNRNDAPPLRNDNPQPNVEHPIWSPSSSQPRYAFPQHEDAVAEHFKEPPSRHARVTQTHVVHRTGETAWARFKGRVARTFRATRAAISSLFSSR